MDDNVIAETGESCEENLPGRCNRDCGEGSSEVGMVGMSLEKSHPWADWLVQTKA